MLWQCKSLVAHGCFRWLAISCICSLANCKPIARQEPVSDAKLALAIRSMVRMFRPFKARKTQVMQIVKSLANEKNYKALAISLYDIRYEVATIKLSYRDEIQKSIKKLVSDSEVLATRNDVVSLIQKSHAHYNAWATRVVEGIHDSLRMNAAYRVDAPEYKLGIRGGFLTELPKTMKELTAQVDLVIKYIETPPRVRELEKLKR